MRTAILALFVSVGLLAVLAFGSFFGYPYLPDYLHVDAKPHQAVQASAVGTGRTPAVTQPVPDGFKGPTAQPTLHGPSGPPPEE